MSVSKRVGCFGCAIVVVLLFTMYLRIGNTKRTTRHIGILEPYFTPEGESLVGSDSLRDFTFDWGDKESAREKLMSAPKVSVYYPVTPDVFRFLQNSNKLEILYLNVIEANKPCVLTGIDSIPLLRTLEISLGGDLNELADYRSLARCKRLKCIVFTGVRFSLKDMKELAQSSSVELLYLHYCNSAPGAIAELRNLSTLNTFASEIASARLFRELSQVSSLERILIGFDTCDALDAIEELKKLPKLKYLSICVKAEKRNLVRAALPDAELRLFDDVR